jgi:hypothetical protein
MKYYVTYSFHATYTAEVEAESIEDAMDKSKDEYYDADFGEAQNIDGEVIRVEDENENIVW